MYADDTSPDLLVKRFHGVGPMLTTDFYRPIGSSGLALIGKLRGSLLMGESTWWTPTSDQNTDDLATILETQIGIEWRSQGPGGWEFLLRAGYENQLWLGAGTYFSGELTPGHFNPGSRSNDHDMAFMGLTFAAGTAR